MATAKKLPSGAWRVQVYAGKDANGKRQYLSFTRPTKKEAEFDALQFQLHYKEVSRDTSAMTLSEAMDKYIKSKDGVLSPSTIRGYDIIKRAHLQGLMDVRLNRLTAAMIQEAINQESKPYTDKKGRKRTPTPKTVRNIHGLLSAVLSEYHPGLKLNTTLPQKQITEQAILEPEEIGALLKAVEGTEMEIPVLLAVWLCMRSSEITGLTWDCVDFQRSTVTVKQAKVRNKDNEGLPIVAICVEYHDRALRIFQSDIHTTILITGRCAHNGMEALLIWPFNPVMLYRISKAMTNFASV